MDPGKLAMAAAVLAALLPYTMRAAAPAGEDTTRTPLLEVPKLPMFDRPVDYPGTLACGVLAPERIVIDDEVVFVGQRLAALAAVFGTDPGTDLEPEAPRTREEQWTYLRRLLRQDDTSMHYYRLSGIYYDDQLSGLFAVRAWTLGDLEIRAHSHRPTADDDARVWLLRVHPACDLEVPVRYEEPPGLRLVRMGQVVARWDVDRNALTIEGGERGRP